MSIRPAQAPQPNSPSLKTEWSHQTRSPILHLRSARESGDVLFATRSKGITLLNRRGEIQAKYQASASITSVDLADVGNVTLVATCDRKVSWLAPDLSSRWEMSFDQEVTAVAVDPHGLCAAIATTSGKVRLLDADQQALSTIQLAQPVNYLAFIPEAPFLVGAGSRGFVTCVQISGEIAWEDRL